VTNRNQKDDKKVERQKRNLIPAAKESTNVSWADKLTESKVGPSKFQLKIQQFGSFKCPL
jgi:hypothetical protein